MTIAVLSKYRQISVEEPSVSECLSILRLFRNLRLVPLVAYVLCMLQGCTCTCYRM